jgi:acyl-CoA synthetase (AMP-forming)/AMP-acid ligase II
MNATRVGVVLCASLLRGATLVTVPVPDPDDLLSFLAARLAEYKRPREVILVDELPRTRAGKLLRRELHGAHTADRAR